jgi:[ribosomal protein S18]-alanine N-acetyltransferase
MNIIIRLYKLEDKQACLEVFKSNCPKYFDPSELELFDKWLDHQVSEGVGYQSPTYSNSEKDVYYVVEHLTSGIIGCGGFYIDKDQKEARLAWGMIHVDFHGQGLGKAIYLHRKNVIAQDWPNHKMTLGTSQHTFPFYQKMGMKVIQSIKSGYGPDLDRYDMVL